MAKHTTTRRRAPPTRRPKPAPAPKLPVNPPPGTYDPALDAAVRAAGRGFGDLQMDVGTANVRAQDDFALGTGHLQDLLQQHLSDLSTGRDRSHQGFVDATDALGRRYANLGVSQAQASVAHSGGATSGALQQALEKRMANQGLEQRPLDQQEAYNAADYNTNVGRAQGGYQFDVGQARARPLARQRGPHQHARARRQGEHAIRTRHRRAALVSGDAGGL
jgi:hypothetical protein